MSTLDLTGVWTLRDVDGEHACSMNLPGDGVTALHEAGLIKEPYWGMNEYDLRWIGERDWTLTRSFTCDMTAYDLVIGELDTVATVFVNGVLVLDAANAFRTHRADVSQALQTGDNTIEVRFRSAIHAAQEAQDEQPFFVPYHTQNNPLHNGNMLRKQQCDFGWDWNIALAPFGVYGQIALEPRTSVRLDHLHIKQTHIEQTHSENAHGDGYVDVTVSAHCQCDGPADLPWRLAIGNQWVSGDAHSQGGEAIIQAHLRIENPALWWPSGLGGQPLVDVTFDVAGLREHRRMGFADIQLISQPDDVGRSFKLQVNGHDVFARGANWIPADALAGQIDRANVRDLLQSAVDANMNMIRVWGGGRYEPDWFYDLCDELGLMVWQDFMFACNLYPATDDFLTEIAAEARDVVARLHHHPCLAVWCGDNEVIGALTWFEESIKDRDRYLVAYDRLNRTIETNLKAIDPGANWWPSSPSPGPLSFGDTWHDDTSGDMHFWSVWHEGRDFDHYRDVSPRFCSEFGFQSYPSMDVIKKFADPKDFNIAAPVMESHQKNKGGNARIAETMFRTFRFPVDFESFVYVSQVQQAIAIKTAVTHWRTLKPHCMGTLYWQLNDTWPVCSWASLNYGGGWKLLHHAAQTFYAPVLVTVVPIEDGYAIKAVNDGRDVAQVCTDIMAVRPDGSGRRLARTTLSVWPDKATQAMVISKDDLAGDEMIVLRWYEAGSGPILVQSDLFAPLPFKAYDLVSPGLSLDLEPGDGCFTMTLSAQALALFATVEADQPGRFCANGITVLPGAPVQLSFVPKNPGTIPSFSVRDLFSATHSSP